MGSAATIELPLTVSQWRYLELIRDNPAIRPTICFCFRIPGALNIDRFIDSVEILVSRHEALRIELFEQSGREPRQRIRDLPSRADLVFCQDVLARSEEQFRRYVRHIAVQYRREDWGGGAYPFRFRLFRYGPAVQVLLVALSHMAVDGIGAEILIRDLMRTYADTLAGRPPRGLPSRRFTDSVARQVAADGKGPRRFADDRDPSGPPVLTRFDLPPAGPAELGGPARQLSLSLEGKELAALREQASLHGGTEFAWILAAFARTVFRFTRQDRINITVPVDLRGSADREVVGMFALMVSVIMERPQDADSGRRFVARAGGALLRAMASCRRGMVPGPRLQANLGLKYQKVSSLDSREFNQEGVAEYMPRVGYSVRGMKVEIYSYPDVLDIQALFDPGVFSADSAKCVCEVLSRNLTSDPGQDGRQSA